MLCRWYRVVGSYVRVVAVFTELNLGSCVLPQVEHHRVVLPPVFHLMGDADPSVQASGGAGAGALPS
jgi:hypothetical protein